MPQEKKHQIPKTTDSMLPARILLVLSPLSAGLSMSALMVFCFMGSLNIVDFELGKTPSLVLDACLCLLFFIQHSIMVRQRYHRWIARWVRNEYHPAIYSIVSGIMLLILLVFWRETELIAEAGPLMYWLLRLVFVLAIAGFIVNSRSIKGFDPYGIRELRRYIRGNPPRPAPFGVAGAYRWVRHPLYFFTLALIWSCPYLTGDRIVFNVLSTIWITLGSAFEELDLVETFGEDYRNYQKQVPMLIPYRIHLFWQKDR